MRVSTNQQLQSLQDQISRASEHMALLQMRVTSGKRIELPSDDPLGAAQVMVWRTAVSNNDQYRSNIQAGQAILKTTEGTLSDMQSLLANARALMVQGANGTLDQGARDSIASQINSLADQIVNMTNSAVVGTKHVFSGQQTQTVPFTRDAGAITYNGDANPIAVEVATDQTLQVNLPGAPIITDIYNMLQQAREHLEAGDVSSVSTQDLASLETQSQSLAAARASIGEKLSQMDALDAQTVRRSDSLKQMISDTEDVDLAQAITDLRGAEVAYQASLTVASSSFGLSLMDFIRGG